MAIVFRCECGKEFQTEDQDAGRRARCPACKRDLVVPQPKPEFHDDFSTVGQKGPPQTSGKAVASFALGLCSFVFCFFTGIPAIFLGIFGLNDIKDPRKNVKGSGLAVTGIVLGGLTSLLVVPMVLIALLLPAVQAAREAARRAQCVGHMKQIALALHNYAAANDCFPPAATYDKDGKPLLSWRVLILPYLSQTSLFDQFALNEPWDSPRNKPLSEQAPEVFRCPSDMNAARMTTYQVVVDPRSIFTGKPDGVQLKTITDGMSTTLLFAESTTPVTWSKPDDLSLTSSDPTLGMGSKHPGGFNVSMSDGSIRFVFFKTSGGNPLSQSTLRGLATRNGNEAVSPP